MKTRTYLARASALLLAAAAFVALPDFQQRAQGQAPAVANPPVDSGGDLSVMTYNVEGLPWPIRFGRSEAFDRIAAQLRDMREHGAQPHVVLLQEAFSSDARSIGAAAGYAHIVDGPDADMPGAALAPRDNDAAFAEGRRFLKGETSGKLLGSGLQILSDYPVLAVRREAFPGQACAGYDCLANKGMVMAIVAVPGQPAPVAIADVHLNSRLASGVSIERSMHAYRAQIDTLATFLQRNVPANMPVVLAGDFNIGFDPARQAYVRSRLAGWLGGARQNAFSACLSASDCRAAMPEDVRRSISMGKDWQFIRAGDGAKLEARRIAAPFGRDASGAMLSDHIGYVVSYDIHPANAGKRRTIS